MKPIRSLILILFLSQATAAFGQITFGTTIKPVKVYETDIPRSLSYIGHVVDALRYTDKDGEHLVVLTETGDVKTIDKECADCKSADIYAYNYKTSRFDQTLAWQVHDMVKYCEFDITAKFVPNALTITDLNKDGKAEVWLMYRTACRSDVSAATMKIIMYEGGQKYAIRGTAKIKVGDNQHDGGSFTFDQAFRSGPIVFRKYAEDLWKRNLTE